MILKFTKKQLIDSGLKLDELWKDDEDFEIFVQKLGYDEKFTSFGVDGFAEIRVYPNLTKKYNYFIELTVNCEVSFILIEGQHNYLQFLKEYIPFLNSLIILDER